MATFADFQSDPSFSAAWNEVEAQFSLEGQPLARVAAFKDQFAGQFEQFTTSGFGGFGLDEASALTACKQFAINAGTVVGAVNTVSGLIGELTSQPPKDILNAFSGAMIAALVGAGAVTAGVGALICSGIGAGLDLLQQAGLFGPPPGIAIQGCPGLSAAQAPDIVVGCVIASVRPGSGSSAQVKPTSANWRSFPTPATSDQAWYTKGSSVGAWRDLDVLAVTAGRPIDLAFPNYAWVERGAYPSGPAWIAVTAPNQSGSPFLKGFARAWRANAEYALNGLKSQSDAQVLLQYLRFWNRAHMGPAVPMLQGGSGGSYVESIIASATNATGPADISEGITDGTSLLVNAGDLKSQPSAAHTIALSRLGLARLSAQTAAATTGGLGSILLLGGAAIAAVAVVKPALLRSWARKVGVRL